MALAGVAWRATAAMSLAVTAVGIGRLFSRSEGAATVIDAVAARASSGHSAAEPGFPPRLSETGLYLADGSVDPRNRPFVPQYALWTDGATKRRWVRLPDDGHIDVREPDAWRFPSGTTFWKEFSWHGRKVETRVIRIGGGGEARFATYVWNEQGTEAILAPEEGVARAHEVARGRWHAIPSVADCQTCHESGPSPVLGLSALQLSDDRDPLAPHGEPLARGTVTLGTLVREDRLRPARPGLASNPPRIRGRDPVERAALGYLSANCGTCHNRRGPLARLGFSLRHEDSGRLDGLEPVLATVVGNAGRFAVPGDTVGTRLVEPGSPDASAVLHRMMSRRAAIQMPPLGTVIVDSAGIDLIRRWIRKLGATESTTGAPSGSASRRRAETARR